MNTRKPRITATNAVSHSKSRMENLIRIAVVLFIAVYLFASHRFLAIQQFIVGFREPLIKLGVVFRRGFGFAPGGRLQPMIQTPPKCQRENRSEPKDVADREAEFHRRIMIWLDQSSNFL